MREPYIRWHWNLISWVDGKWLLSLIVGASLNLLVQSWLLTQYKQCEVSNHIRQNNLHQARGFFLVNKAFEWRWDGVVYTCCCVDGNPGNFGGFPHVSSYRRMFSSRHVLNELECTNCAAARVEGTLVLQLDSDLSISVNNASLPPSSPSQCLHACKYITLVHSKCFPKTGRSELKLISGWGMLSHLY